MTKNEELKDIVQRYLNDTSKRLDQIMNYIRSNYRELYNYVFDYTKKLDKKYNFSHRLYWTINNIVDFPVCPTCGKKNLRQIKVKDGYDGPKKYCCNSCITKSSEYQQKYKETNLERYGVENVFQSDIIKERIKQSCLSKYGVKNISQNEDIKNKIKKTNIEKYGVDNVLKSNIIKQKVIDTNLERYGIKSPFEKQEFRDKSKRTLIERYGFDNASLVKEFQDKRKQTFIDKYGTNTPLQNEEIKNKAIQTNLERYGVEWSLGNKEIREKSKETIRIKYGVDCITQSDVIKNKIRTHKLINLYNRLKDNKFVKLLTPLDEFINCNPGYEDKFKWICKRCGKEFESTKNKYRTSDSIFYAKCPYCFPLQNFKSNTEQYIFNYLKDKYPNLEIIYGDRKLLQNNKEIDIYIPSKKLAIEFDGIRWHSFQMLNCDKNYHLNKTEICESKGIQLIHIFEDEWIKNEDIVLSRIDNLLGIYSTKIYARKCIVKELSYNECKQFLDKNHIQGSVNTKYNIALYYDNEIVSLMTFSHLRKALGFNNTNDTEYELVRYCSKINTHVIGAASKLFKHFINKYNPSKIISYADRRWSIGKLYYRLGFKLDHISNPNYWYVINNKREHRFNWRKDILKNKLDNFDPNLTEYENMLYNGYDCIYDCGNMVFIWYKE